MAKNGPVPTRNSIRAQNAVFGHFRGRSNLTHPPFRLRSYLVIYNEVVCLGENYGLGTADLRFSSVRSP